MNDHEIETIIMMYPPDFGWCEEGLEEYAINVWVIKSKRMFILQQGLGAGYYCDFRSLVQRLHEIMRAAAVWERS